MTPQTICQICVMGGRDEFDKKLQDAPDASLECDDEAGWVKRTLCKFWLKGICERGSNCGFAHGEEESRSRRRRERKADKARNAYKSRSRSPGRPERKAYDTATASGSDKEPREFPWSSQSKLVTELTRSNDQLEREAKALRRENSDLKDDLADLQHDLNKAKEVAKNLRKDKADLQSVCQAMHKVNTDWVEKNALLSAQLQRVLTRAMQW